MFGVGVVVAKAVVIGELKVDECFKAGWSLEVYLFNRLSGFCVFERRVE